MKLFQLATPCLHRGLLWLSLSLLMGWGGLGRPVSAQAQEIIFSDDFSQGLQKWQPTRDDGRYWSIVNGQAEALVPYGSTITELVPKNDYWDVGWQNYEFEYDLTPVEGVDRNTSFAWIDLKTWYELHFVQSVLNIAGVQSGLLTLNTFDNFSMTNGLTYRVKISFDRGRVKVWVDGQLIADHLDNRYLGGAGKIGLKAGTGAIAPTRLRYDNVLVRLVPTDITLTVNQVRQNDPTWKNDIYDSATDWSDQPTIERWGCLLSSIVMVFDYYHLTQFPDGTLITPASLNVWLKTQADGFVGQGLVNWTAITRLTQLSNAQFGTPKLEYQAVLADNLLTAISEIKKSRPAILQIPKHFLVASGVVAGEADLLIQDSLFDYQKFSQHQQPPLSTRQLIPSQTDLGYLLATWQPELAVGVTDSSGQAVTGWQVLSETIGDLISQSGERTPNYQVGQLAKPVTSRYQFTISQPQLQPFKLELWAYDQVAHPTQLTQQGMVGDLPLTFGVDYSPTGQSLITIIMSWGRLRDDVNWLNQTGQFKSNIVAVNLKRWIDLAEKNPDLNAQKRYLNVISQFTKANRQRMSESGYQYLNQQLRFLELNL